MAAFSDPWAKVNRTTTNQSVGENTRTVTDDALNEWMQILELTGCLYKGAGGQLKSWAVA